MESLRRGRALNLADRLLAHRELFDQVLADAVAGAGAVGDGNRALGRNLDLGVDDVFFPIAPGGGDVPRETEVFERGEGDVVGAPDAGFEHASAPDGNVADLADVMNFPGFAEAAQASNLDVDDAAGAAFDRGGGIARAFDRLVKTDGGVQFALQAGVVEDVIVPQRLLDHQQVKLIELAQVLDFVEGIGGVSVAAEQDVGPPRADFFEDVYVPAGFDFHFDAAVSGGEFGLNLVEQLVDGVLDADGNAALDFAACAAQKLPQGQLLLAGFAVPEGVFDGGFGHAVAADPCHQGGALPGRGDVLADHRRREMLAQRGPGASDPFARIVRIFTGDALPPAVHAFAVHGDEQDAAMVEAAEARLEKVDERHLNLAERDGFNFHGKSLNRKARQGRTGNPRLRLSTSMVPPTCPAGTGRSRRDR